jgi:hypothetical protein
MSQHRDRNRPPITVEPTEALDNASRPAAGLPVRKPDSKRRVPSRLGKGPTPGSWKKGQSGNPRGGPRSGLALATTIRERIDPEKVLDIVCEYIDDADVPAADKLDRLLPWLHAGFLKPPTATSLHVTTETTEPLKLAHLSDAELELRLAWLKGEVRELPESSESDTDEPPEAA